jgi:hypothetical protein
MFQDRDEFMLLSRGGRVPRARAGPRYREQLAPHDRDNILAGSTGRRLTRRAFRPSRLWETLGRGGRAGRQPARSPSISAYADPECYLDLEFAVGFEAVEDEQLL